MASKKNKKTTSTTLSKTKKKAFQPIEKKAVKKTSVNKNKNQPKSQNISEQLKLNESYVSLILGSVVVIGIFAIIFVYVFQTRNEVKTQRVLNNVVTPSPEPEEDVYVMQEGESLWDVAVRFYGDGYSYIKIVEANKEVIPNPDYVPPGTEIILPGVSN